MKHHINYTNETVRFKTWVLFNQSITPDGAAFLKSAGIGVRVEIEPEKIDWRGVSYSYVNKHRIEFETTCDKQETMLKLKYGKDILLVLDEMVLPNSMSMCTLSEINFNGN